MSEPLHIAVSCNERYTYGALVALSGVAANAKPNTELKFHVFTEGVKAESIEWMRSTLARIHEQSELLEHKCEENLLNGLPYWAGSRMAAVRCYYASLMPAVDWCLYLDCDVLYLASVEEHFSYRDDFVYACVVQEEAAGTRKKECAWIGEEVGVRIEDEKYFNSGVMLFNFKKIRADGIPRKLAAFFKEHPNVPSPDQDALNAVFAGCVKLIPAKFDRLQTRITDEKINERPAIHYVGGNPWLPKLSVVANNRFKLWHRFADRYVWQGEPGASYKYCFSKRILWIKKTFYHLLRMPLIGAAFALAMKVTGLVSSSKTWRWRNVGNDISVDGIEGVMS